MKPFAIVASLILSFLFGVLPAHPGQALNPDPKNSKGYLEIECNLAGVDLHACPRDRFERKTIRKFFGLFTSHQTSCAVEALFLGTTPMQPVELPEGSYVLQIPPGYVWEHEAPIEVSISAGQKTFLPLKLFQRQSVRKGADSGGPGSAPGGSTGGGSGTGGTPGGAPPQ